MQEHNSSMEREKLRLILNDVSRGDWDAVVDNYRDEVRKVKISASGDTLMHLTATARFRKTEHIRKMLGKIGETEAFEILSIKDDGGNTVLHIAAGVGDAAVCHCIAAKNVMLLSVPNREGATPLYISVANGHRDAFYTLDFLLQKERQKSRQAIDYSFYKMDNGWTILHAAVFGEFFGLAIQIFRMYPALANLVDNSGLSPIHILAGKPSAFFSSYQLGYLRWIIFKCVNVDQLVEKELKRPVVMNPEFHARSIDIESNDDIFQQDGN